MRRNQPENTFAAFAPKIALKMGKHFMVDAVESAHATEFSQ